MFYRLGKTFLLPPVDLTAPDSPATPELLFVDETVIGVEGSTLKVSIPPTDPATHHRLLELRAYLAPHDQQPPADEAGYRSSDLPYAVIDVSALAGPGGLVDIPLPEVDRVVPYFGQLVHGYAD